MDTDFDRIVNQANQQREQGDWDAAIATLTAAIPGVSNQREQAYLYWLRGKFRRARNDLKLAIQDFSQAIDLMRPLSTEPEVPFRYQCLVRFLRLIGISLGILFKWIPTGNLELTWDGDEKCFLQQRPTGERLYFFPPPLPAALFWRGVSYFAQGETAKGWDDYTELVSRLSTPPRYVVSAYHFYQGAAAYDLLIRSHQDQLDDLEPLRADINRLVETRPQDPISYLLRGLFHGALHDYEGAYADVRQMLKRMPRFGQRNRRKLGQRLLAHYRIYVACNPDEVAPADLARMQPGIEYAYVENPDHRDVCQVIIFDQHHRHSYTTHAGYAQCKLALEAEGWQLKSRHQDGDGGYYYFQRPLEMAV